MADNSSSIDAWAYRPIFPDSASWITDSFIRDNEALTKALQISLSDDSSASETLSSTAYLRPPQPPIAAPSRSPIACSPSRKITKRKSRASKRSPTTYINADPANFRRMVQEVTGIRLGDGGVPVEPVGRPEPQRSGLGRPGQVQGYLPTLDTSALLLDRAGLVGPGTLACGSFGPGVDGPVFEFEPFPSFPTLESWGM
ncbi:calmodulin-binding protein 25-like [Phalaenopsis equestris]|uniref:calmodulin-binding protein 25-like n=1 Tax=Phalaenopsis equestris TaxID=78828 RepID=UPI0009E2266D|nr:calmodulin-binding protein 25-like [Phalaenopsis equestris]